MKTTNEYGTAYGYFTKSEYQKPGIYKAPEGYTANAWIGSNCPKNRFLPVKEVAKYIRDYIRKNPELNVCKWSITTKSYSGGQSLTVALMAAPFEVFSDEWKQKHPHEVETGYTQHADFKDVVTHEAFAVISKVKAFANSFNYDDSDGMIDYFDRGFYDHYHIGKFDKPFIKIEPRTETSNGKAEPNAHETHAADTNGVQIIEYSEKAIAVVGDTKPIKNTLRELGGRFNTRLSCGAGWIFPKTKTGAIREALAI